jgi:hypothetical protein
MKIMINKILLTGLLLCLQQTLSFSQNDSTHVFKNNAVYIETVGSVATYFSLNYERKVIENKNAFFTARAGIYLLPDIAMSALLMNYVLGKKNHHLEVGGGIRLATIKEYHRDKPKWVWDKDELAGTANFMYRYQKPNGGLLIRAGWTPVIYRYITNESELFKEFSFLLIGISVGYTF